jgi:hypothetical protein
MVNWVTNMISVNGYGEKFEPARQTAESTAISNDHLPENSIEFSHNKGEFCGVTLLLNFSWQLTVPLQSFQAMAVKYIVITFRFCL